MFKMPIVIAVFLPSVAFAAMPALAPGTQTPQPEQSRSTHGARVSGQLSMGPDGPWTRVEKRQLPDPALTPG
jgi:hypothetical protein